MLRTTPNTACKQSRSAELVSPDTECDGQKTNKTTYNMIKSETAQCNTIHKLNEK